MMEVQGVLIYGLFSKVMGESQLESGKLNPMRPELVFWLAFQTECIVGAQLVTRTRVHEVK
ncbi:hypothetical protein CSKR_100888 [Clonorchis sinensis]|uniref:Uncharacterized protein n=2 Tax=Clonorchis sinensis TaxID=79923 RepID=A0A8T1MGN4_CLOSI|nr:hypothetical protein CSKR_100888 [Clonorchis sinensis]GAA50369.1 hypothetical protein CLF_104432 [Clonorchis sinensis]